MLYTTSLFFIMRNDINTYLLHFIFKLTIDQIYWTNLMMNLKFHCIEMCKEHMYVNHFSLYYRC
jgi:hypothetical protein